MTRCPLGFYKRLKPYEYRNGIANLFTSSARLNPLANFYFKIFRRRKFFNVAAMLVPPSHGIWYSIAHAIHRRAWLNYSHPLNLWWDDQQVEDNTYGKGRIIKYPPLRAELSAHHNNHIMAKTINQILFTQRTHFWRNLLSVSMTFSVTDHTDL